MIEELKGFPAKGGKTKSAIEKVSEHLLLGSEVLYITNELTFDEILKRISVVCDNIPLDNLKVCYSYDDEYKKFYSDNKDKDNTVFVFDIGKYIPESFFKTKNKVFIYYQKPSLINLML